nr:I protein [Human coronavirus HKU1]
MLEVEAPLEIVQESSRKLLGLTNLNEITKPLIEAEKPNLNSLCLLNHKEILSHIIPGSPGSLNFKKVETLNFQMVKEFPLLSEYPLLKQKDIGIDTAGVFLKQLMVNKSSCYRDGISTISVPAHMPMPPMVNPSKGSSGLLITKLTLLLPPMFRQGILLLKKLSLLGFRLVRFCLKAIMLKAQEGLLLIVDQVHVLNHVDPIIVH